jgi:hypothetical protein
MLRAVLFSRASGGPKKNRARWPPLASGNTDMQRVEEPIQMRAGESSRQGREIVPKRWPQHIALGDIGRLHPLQIGPLDAKIG